MQPSPRDPQIPLDVQQLLPAAQRYLQGLGGPQPQGQQAVQAMGFPAMPIPPKPHGAA